MTMRTYLQIAYKICLVAMVAFTWLSLSDVRAAPQEKRPNLLLSNKDTQLYQTIFTTQQQGNMDEADLAIAELKDRRLLGHVLYQRYLHPTAYVSSFDELKAWLEFYSDHPGAEKIYNLAMKKAGSSQKQALLRQPSKRTKIRAIAEPTMVFAKPYTDHGGASDYDKSIEKKVLRYIRKDQKDKALDVIYAENKKGEASAYQIDYLKSRAAERYLYDGKIKLAHELAAQAYRRSGDRVPLAGWVYGLSAWYNGSYAAAAQGFKSAAISKQASGWLQAASSFWAARAYDRLGHTYEVGIWLMKAQDHPRTFYGLLAHQAMGKKFDFNWETPPLTRDMVRSMAKSRATMRALALMDIGRYDWAEQEFLYVDIDDDTVKRAMLAFAQSYNMAELSYRLGSNVKSSKGKIYDAALYPDLDMSQVDRKRKYVDLDLVQAIARQESRFNPYALSHSGAVGLMQIMPDTARYVANRYDLVLGSTKTLLLPAYNIKFGQYYIHDLLASNTVGDDLIYALIAYNAGPGNLRKWQKMWPEVKDPLLFIELLPVTETRKYVERVLANYWIYRVKHGRDLNQLQPIITGEPLRYAQIVSDLPYNVANKR